MQTQRPRLKMAAPLLRAGGELHVVGSHDVTSIPDPDGAVLRLFQLADGSRSTTQLYSELVSEFPRLGEQDVADAVWELESAGLFENPVPRMRILG